MGHEAPAVILFELKTETTREAFAAEGDARLPSAQARPSELADDTEATRSSTSNKERVSVR